MRGPGRALIRLRTRAGAAVPVIVLIALAARLIPVTRGGGLTGVLAYDDGVYYSAADALLSGRLPYRDFVLLHPPGITLALAPFAELGRLVGADAIGFAAARVTFMLLGALNAVLVWAVARRLSARAGLVAGLFYAVWAPATYAERTTLLEPLVNLGLLAALALLGADRTSRRRVLLAGLALGLAVAVKAWAVVAFAVLAIWLLRRDGRRAAVAYLAAGVAAAGAVCLPFLVVAGPRMLRMVVLDQLARPNNGVSIPTRLASIEGLQVSPSPVHGQLALTAVVVAVGAAVLAGLVAWRQPRARVWAALLGAQVTLLLTSPSYFGHYATFAAPALALLAGAAADGAVAWLGARMPMLTLLGPPVGLAALAVLSAHVVTQPEGRRVPFRAAEEALAPVRCIAADSAGALVAADVLTRDLKDGCPVVVDVTGLTYTQDRGDLAGGPTPEARRRDVEWQRTVARYFNGSGAVLLDQWSSDGLDDRLLARLVHRDRVYGTPSYRVLVPFS